MPRGTSAAKISLLSLAVALTACPGSPDQVREIVSPPPLADFLAQNGWIVLPIPDNKAGPANIIQVTQVESGASNVRWIGDFRRCGLSNEDLGYIEGKYPSIGTGRNFSLDVGTTLKLTPVDLGANIETARSAILNIGELGGDAIDLLALSLWLAAPGNLQNLPEACTQFLSQPNVYLITEAFRISSGNYEFRNNAGGRIAVSFPAGTPLNASGGLKVGSNGSVEFTDDVYFAVRRVKQVAPGTFETLGEDPEAIPEADDALRADNVQISP